MPKTIKMFLFYNEFEYKVERIIFIKLRHSSIRWASFLKTKKPFTERKITKVILNFLTVFLHVNILYTYIMSYYMYFIKCILYITLYILVACFFSCNLVKILLTLSFKFLVLDYLSFLFILPNFYTITQRFIYKGYI